MSAFTLDVIPDAIAAFLPPSARLSYPEQGMTADVMFASNEYQSVVVKRCAHPVYIDWLRREQQVLRLLLNTELPVPRFIYYSESLGEAGVEGWLVTSRLRGRSLWKIVLAIQPPQRAPLLHSLGQLLRRLHTTPIPGSLCDQPSWMARKLAEAEVNLPWCDGKGATLERLRKTQPLSVPEVFIHGDTALDNVLIDDDQQLHLIDWATGDSGDYRCDIALALQSEPETTFVEEELQAFYTGYAGPYVDIATRKWYEDLWEFF